MIFNVGYIFQAKINHAWRIQGVIILCILSMSYLLKLGLKYTWNVLMKENSDLMWKVFESTEKNNKENNATLPFNKITV